MKRWQKLIAMDGWMEAHGRIVADDMWWGLHNEITENN